MPRLCLALLAAFVAATAGAEPLGARLVLLSDPSGAAAKAYGVTSLGGLYARRWISCIDRHGIVHEIGRNVSVESAGQDIARKLGELGGSRAGSGLQRDLLA